MTLKQAQHSNNLNATMHKSCLLLFAMLLLVSGTLVAQQGFGTHTPNAQSVVHMEGVNQGVLIPNVSLTNATTFLGGVTATAEHLSMLVYNTNTATTNGLSGTGYYYWNGTAWVRLTTTAAAGGGINLVDADGDTRIQVEEIPDEDLIRFDVASREWMRLDNRGVLSFGGAIGSPDTANLFPIATSFTDVTDTAARSVFRIGSFFLVPSGGGGSESARTYFLPVTRTNTKGFIDATAATTVVGAIKSAYWVYFVGNDASIRAVKLNFRLSGTMLQVSATDGRIRANANPSSLGSQTVAFFEGTGWTAEAQEIQNLAVAFSNGTASPVLAKIESGTGNAYFKGTLSDSSNDVGNSGQILSSTSTGTDWVDASAISPISLFDDDTNTGIQVEKTNDDDTIRFDTAGAERMLINNAGNVGIGIGTNVPTAKLDIRNSMSASAGGLTIMHDNGTQGLAFGFRGISKVGSAINTPLYLDATGTGHILLNTVATGNVGIGTTINPADKLHVEGSARITGALKDSKDKAGTTGQLLSSTVNGTEWVGINDLVSLQKVTNANATITAGVNMVIVKNTTGAKISLALPTPETTDHPAGSILRIVRDGNNNGGSNDIDITGTINGSTTPATLNGNYQLALFVAGTGTWLHVE